MGADTATKSKVLVIDDDDELCALLSQYLGRFQLTVTTAAHPEAGLRLMRTSAPDLVVLDVMLPSMDGFAVCRKIRETSRVPIIMLTARGDVADRVMGLELGADDYLPKPFEPRELVARINAVLRRGIPAGPAQRICVRGLAIDLAERSATLNGRAIDLTTAEFELLALLAKARGRVMTREKILDETRGLEWDSFDRSVDVLVSRLRHKLGEDSKSPQYVKTVWGRGYCLVGDVHE